jgi:hypothetical protein
MAVALGLMRAGIAQRHQSHVVSFIDGSKAGSGRIAMRNEQAHFYRYRGR